MHIENGEQDNRNPAPRTSNQRAEYFENHCSAFCNYTRICELPNKLLLNWRSFARQQFKKKDDCADTYYGIGYLKRQYSLDQQAFNAILLPLHFA